MVTSNWQYLYDSGVLLKTIESNTVSLVTINRQNSYHQDYGSIQGLPINCTRFADWVMILVVHLMSQRIEIIMHPFIVQLRMANLSRIWNVLLIKGQTGGGGGSAKKMFPDGYKC